MAFRCSPAFLRVTQKVWKLPVCQSEHDFMPHISTARPLSARLQSWELQSARVPAPLKQGCHRSTLISQIMLRCMSPQLALPGQLYWLIEPNGKRISIDELVPFRYTATRFGGRGQWLTCLRCRRRCRRLFGRRYFRCRQCHGLQYASRNQSRRIAL